MTRFRLLAGLTACFLPLFADEKLAVATSQRPFLFEHQNSSTSGLAETICSPWNTVLSANVRTSAGKDLLITLSATTTMHASGTLSYVLNDPRIAKGAGVILVRLLLDNNTTADLAPDHPSLVAPPSVWTELSTFLGAFSTSQSLHTSQVSASATGSYSYLRQNPGAGNHAINVQARSCVSVFLAQSTEASGSILLGNRTLVVEEVRASVQ